MSASLAVRVPVTGVRSPSVAAPLSAEMTGRSSVPVIVMVTVVVVPSTNCTMKLSTLASPSPRYCTLLLSTL
ncbi:hypothetical protein D3C78_1257280 [compost metagenome]